MTGVQTCALPICPSEISSYELRGYVGALHEAEYAKSSIARRLASLRSFYRFGQREGWVENNPAKALRNPRQGRSLPHFLSAEDIGRLLSTPSAKTVSGKRDRAILETMYSAGLRVSEAVGLNDGDLDFRAGVVRVRGKGKRERFAPIGSYATEALNRWLDVRRLHAAEPSGAEAPVFVNKFGHRITTRSVARMLEKHLKVAGLDGRTSPHSLRHSFATHLLDGGADVRVVQELLGHASVTTTQLYTLVTAEHLREVFLTAHPRAR